MPICTIGGAVKSLNTIFFHYLNIFINFAFLYNNSIYCAGFRLAHRLLFDPGRESSEGSSEPKI